jgi:hypothetical protein
MGLLDDAIREHLELKRKHGADPEDVARQENEALGQGGPRAEFAQPAVEPEAPAPKAAAPAEAAPPADPPAPEFQVPEFEPAAEPPAPEPEPVDELPQGEPGITEIPTEDHPAAAPGYDEDPWLDDEPDEVPAEESLEKPKPEPTGEEDVLEETPDFLQETPEHDRLWFEQKPPRDFDWDK